MAEHLGRAGLEVAAVVLDGAMGVDLRDGSRFHDAAFPPSSAVDVLELFRRHGLEPCVYVDETDVDVVLPAVPSTCSAHVEYLGSIARTGDLDAIVGHPGCTDSLWSAENVTTWRRSPRTCRATALS